MFKTEADYRRFTKPAELHKAINTLKGIVSGVSSDGSVSDGEMRELLNWCDLHRFLCDRHPFDEIIPLVNSAFEDDLISADETQDILWVCNNVLNDGGYYDLITSGIQQLEGLLHGVLADNQITDKEIQQLRRWLEENDFLRGCYPFDEIDSLIAVVLADGKVTDEERDMLKAYFSQFVDLTSSYNLNSVELEKMRTELSLPGICAIDPELNFNNSCFCFTGKSYKATRDEIADRIVSLGGVYNDRVIQNTQYLIVGNAGNPCWAFSCYGRKVEQAVKLRKNGSKIMIVGENDFWDSIG